MHLVDNGLVRRARKQFSSLLKCSHSLELNIRQQILSNIAALNHDLIGLSLVTNSTPDDASCERIAMARVSHLPVVHHSSFLFSPKPGY